MDYIFSYIKRFKFRYALGILILMGVDFASLYIPQLTGAITDGLGTEGYGTDDIMRHIGFILLVGGIMVAGRFGWRYFIFGSARKIECEMRNDLFDHLTKLSPAFYNRNKTGDLMALFTNDISSIRMAIGPAIVSGFDAIMMTIMVLIKMIDYVDVRLTLMACLPMLVIFFGSLYYCREADRRYTRKQEGFSKMTDEVQESISGIRVIKAFVQEQKELRSFEKINRHNMDMNMKVVKLDLIVFSILDFLIGISSAITLFYGGYLVINKEISIGEFVAFNQYVGMLVWPMIATGDCVAMVTQGHASAKRVRSIMNEQPEVVDDSNALDIKELEGHIRLNNLTFSYIKGTKRVLDGVSVDIPKGSTLAILGKTGTGKTTIANLLLRMYNVKSGMIEIDGNSIEKIPLDTLHKQIAYVPQDNFLFSDTVQSNIAFGVRELIDLPEEKDHVKVFKKKSEQLDDIIEGNSAGESVADKVYDDLDGVMEAAKLAAIHDNIMDFPKQYATVVGERGVTMSGGQKQRSSIARALMKDSPILILDDALSAVDTDTEEVILENLKKD
ncbi:MAG: ATP-binding cassette domain-containing protein, partial [Lachnospiraceae bacterium]|nr:ATP-binding cassette domain-containing protein [Lachnospiraceae bacterium]